MITLRIFTALLGKAHAATEVKLDQTEYSSDAKQYVQAFVEAWRNGNTKRMLALSAEQSVVDFFTHYTPPETYQVCSPPGRVGLAGADLQQRRGTTTACSFADASRGKPHAISGPTIGQLPPECS